MEPQQPFGWYRNLHFDRERQNHASTTTLDHLKEQNSIIEKIACAIEHNELSSNSPNVYTSD